MVKLSEVPLGALVVCEIFHLFEHTGIYIGEGQIVELQGTGLVRSVSIPRFMDNRSGEELMVACDSSGKPIGNMAAAERAASQIFTYQTYDLLGTSSLTQPVSQPGVNSLTCLSCHDGTLAIVKHLGQDDEETLITLKAGDFATAVGAAASGAK